MSSLVQVLFFSAVGGVFSLAGGLLLLSSKKMAQKLSVYATPFAAGALLAAAFLDLLQEAAADLEAESALSMALVGLLGFFFLERFLRWFHHHHGHDDSREDPDTPLIIIGDTLHNFIDGIAIAAGFLVSPSTGVVATLAVAAHEIPQEIGDIGLLLSKGMSRRKVILVNIASAMATVLAAGIFYSVGQEVAIPISSVLGLVAGMFIYIAASDIIPSIHQSEASNLIGLQTVLLVCGVIVVMVATNVLHDYVEHSDHEASSGYQTVEVQKPA